MSPALPRAAHRLSAILAADIVGYSRLIDQGEAGRLAAIKDLRGSAIDPLLVEHKGRIVKLMGDGALAALTFAHPEDETKLLAGARKAKMRICATNAELTEFASPRRLPECMPAPDQSAAKSG